MSCIRIAATDINITITEYSCFVVEAGKLARDDKSRKRIVHKSHVRGLIKLLPV